MLEFGAPHAKGEKLEAFYLNKRKTLGAIALLDNGTVKDVH